MTVVPTIPSAASSTTAPTKPAPTDHWPAFTNHTTSDVVIAAVSITRLVEWCGTPCVHTADAVVPNTGGRPSESELASVVIAQVLTVEWRSDLRLHVAIDANLDGCVPVLSQARLMGRESHGRAAAVILEAHADAVDGHAVSLPADIAPGDLVVMPCAGVTLLHNIKVTKTAAAAHTGAGITAAR